MTTVNAGESDKSGDKTPGVYQVTLSILISVAVLAYIIGTVSGVISEQRKMDAVTLGIIALAGIIIVGLLRPQIIERITRIELGGLKVDLEEVKKKQADQEGELKNIRLLLPLLLSTHEQKHLTNLKNGNTAGYLPNLQVRTEVRRLLALELLERRQGKSVEGMKDGSKPDLADFVKLTKLGAEWAERIEKIAKDEEARKKELGG